MHKHKRRRRGSRFFFPGGMIWWIIFAIIFMKGDWWFPWLLIAGGCWWIFGSMFDDEKEKPNEKNVPVSNVEPAPQPVVSKPTVIPNEPMHNAALLPATCSQCGAPVSPYEVKWRGQNSASCSYCGSSLRMKD